MGTRVLIKKEISEILRTYRIYVIPSVFLLFGLVSPIVAKILPDLLSSMAGEIQIQLPTPTWVDAFSQYFKNMIQIGLLTVILSMMGTVADEKGTGSLLMVLSRPVSRHSVVIAKFGAHSLLLTVSIILSYLACWYNTWVLFPDVPLSNTALAVFLFWVYAVFIGSLTLFGSSIVKNNLGAGGIGIAGFFVSAILPSIHKVFATYSPGALTSHINSVLAGAAITSEIWWTVGISLGLGVVLVVLGSFIFNRQEL